MHEPAHLNYACTVFGTSTKGADWQTDLIYLPVDKRGPFIRT